MKKKGKPQFETSEEDKTLFREAVGGIKPVKVKRLHFNQDITKPDWEKRRAAEQEAEPEFYFLTEAPLEEVDHDTMLFFAKEGLNHRTIRELKQGKISFEATLDLHGLIANEAEQRLFKFLETCQTYGMRCVCIIHGKGYRNLAAPNPILKNKVNHWLRNSDKVLAFCSALPKDGGTGAIYLILKKK